MAPKFAHQAKPAKQLAGEALVAAFADAFPGEIGGGVSTAGRPRLPSDATQIERFRRLLGEEGSEYLLKAVKPAELGCLIEDTTVQPKSIAHPVDSRLLKITRHKVVAAAKRYGIALTQTYAQEGKTLPHRAGGYAFASVDGDNPGAQIIHRGKSKSLSGQEKKQLKRLQAIAPLIGHAKADHRMDRCRLQGAVGDASHALSCAAGYNIRWLLRAITRMGLKGLVCALSAMALWVLRLVGVAAHANGPAACTSTSRLGTTRRPRLHGSSPRRLAQDEFFSAEWLP